MNNRERHELADRLAKKHGGSLVSGRRTPSRNEKVGGHPRSRHVYGWAEDYMFDTLEGAKALGS